MNQLRTWTEALLRRPSYAAGFALLCTVLPLLPIIAWAWLALTALRYGARYSVWVLAGVVLGTFLEVAFAGGVFAIALIRIGALIVPIWLFSLLLRRTVSLNFTVQCMAVVLAVLLVLGNLCGIIELAATTEFLQARLNKVVTTSPDLLLDVQLLAEMVVVVWPSTLFWSYVLSVFLGRGWQAVLDNPGGLQREFHALRLHYLVAGVAFVLVFLMLSFPVGAIVQSVGFLSLNTLVLFGLGFVHAWVQTKKWSNWVLVGLYLLLVFLMPLLILVAAVDSVADLRKRLN